ncbi:hypothetical protein NEOKW01_0637 [Nematocida sp. AWRm80]|nr:hypothetical protein NEOKW01_0637 [Nematocida sp. AWRm80]
MLAQGKDIVVIGEAHKLSVHSLKTGMGVSFTIKSKTDITAVGCLENNELIVVGCSDGTVYACRTDSVPGSECILEKAQVVCRMSLRITSIKLFSDIGYIASENGTIKVISIEKVFRTENIPAEDTIINNSKEGWLDTIETICEKSSQDFSLADSSVKPVDSIIKEYKYIFKLLREIKHNMPIKSVEVFGKRIYALDMRKRVKVFPSKIVYENISRIHFKKYLFCIDDVTVFAEIGETFTSIYFSEAEIIEISSSILGGYFFLLTKQNTLEVIQIHSKGATLVYKQIVPSGTKGIVIDSDRSILYTVEANSKVNRLDLGYIWIDVPICSLEIEESRIEKVMIDEEPIEVEDEYFDVPAPKITKALPEPISNHKQDNYYVKDRTKDQLEEGLLNLFDDEDYNPVDTIDIPDAPETGTTRVTTEYINTPDGYVLDKPVHLESTIKYQECVKNSICGPFTGTQGKSTLAFWAPECKVVLSSMPEYTLVEVTIRTTEIDQSSLREQKSIQMVSCSKRILLLITDTIQVFVTDTCTFTEDKKVLEIIPRHSVHQAVCGTSFFALVTKRGLENELSVYSEQIEEIFSLSGQIKGISASGDYLSVFLRESDGICARLFKYTGKTMLSLSQAYSSHYSIDFCSINSLGVSVFESYNQLYALGKDRIVCLSNKIEGVPIALALDNLVCAERDSSEKDKLLLFPETFKYSLLSKESLFSDKPMLIHNILVDELNSSTAQVSSYHNTNNHSNESSENSLNRVYPFDSTTMMKKVTRVPVSFINTPIPTHTPTKISSDTVDSISEPSVQRPTKKVRYSNPFARNTQNDLNK